MEFYGVDDETERKLMDIASERLEGKIKTTIVKPYLETLEAEERPLREKLVLAVFLGIALVK